MKVDILRSRIQLQMSNRQAAQNSQLLLGEFGEQILIAAAERNLPAATVPRDVASLF